MRLGIVLGLLAWTLAASPALARRVEVPVQGRGHALVVDAMINQRFSGRFLIDTGASYCVLSKASAKNASVRPDGERIKMATANGVVEVQLGSARRIDLGGAVAREVDVAVMDHEPLPGLQGVIGLSFLRQFKYSIDHGRGVLLLEQ
jgi:clan AA aspartic protease (TIGR02281 family)